MPVTVYAQPPSCWTIRYVTCAIGSSPRNDAMGHEETFASFPSPLTAGARYSHLVRCAAPRPAVSGSCRSPARRFAGILQTIAASRVMPELSVLFLAACMFVGAVLYT